MSKVLTGVSELLGTFIQDMADAEETPKPELRRSKRSKTAQQSENDGEEDIDEDPDYDDGEEWISSSEDGSDEDFESEDNQDEEGEDEQEQGEKEEEEEEEEEEDLVPISRRLKRMQSATSQAGRVQTATATDSSVGIPTLQPMGSTGSLISRRSRLILPDKLTNGVDGINMVGATDQGCSSRDQKHSNEATSSKAVVGDVKGSSWDFPAPDCDIMKFIVDPTPPQKVFNTQGLDPIGNEFIFSAFFCCYCIHFFNASGTKFIKPPACV